MCLIINIANLKDKNQCSTIKKLLAESSKSLSMVNHIEKRLGILILPNLRIKISRMASQFKASGYNITTDPDFQNERFGNTEALISQFNELFIEAQNKKNKKIIDRLTKLIIKYPKSPQLKNFLSVAYNVQGNYKKAIELNNWILAEHPDYLFAKLNLANQYINEGNPEKVAGVLVEAMEIKDLYPDRDLFHLAEVTGFYKLAIHYYVALKNLDLAQNRFDVLKDIAPDHPDTASAETLLFSLQMEKGMDRWKEENEARTSVKYARPVPTSKLKTAPVFNHPQVKDLYDYGIDIPQEILKEIVALDRNTVIADLEKILEDAVVRYQYFLDLEEQCESPLHAICLLAELKSENSLEAVLSFLENHEEVLGFWLGDHITETIWMPLYSLSQNKLQLLKRFLLQPGIYTFSKAAVSEALAQAAIYHPEKSDEIAGIYKEMLSFFNNSELKDNVIDSDFLGLAIADIIDCGFVELLPEIKPLFEKGYVDLGMNGPYDDVIKHINDPNQRAEKKKIENIFELYERISNTWVNYEDERNHSNYDNYEIREQAVSKKIGRNDPCPCGSGKKYKKCCMNKQTL